MSLKVYLKISTFIVVIALLYIHMQTKIYELSYKGKDKERIIHELNDSNGALKHQILTMESANHLGNTLLERDKNLQFMDNQRVMVVKAPAGTIQRVEEPKPKVTNPVWQLFSFLGAQEAKAWE